MSFGVAGAAIVTGIVLPGVSGSSHSDEAPAVSAWVADHQVGLSGRF